MIASSSNPIRSAKAPKLGFAGSSYMPYSKNEIMAMLQNVTSSAGLDHVWDKQTQHSYLQFDESLWSKLLEQLGFGILLFARGSFLKDLQDEARQRFQKGAKVKVANDFEVQDPRRSSVPSTRR